MNDRILRPARLAALLLLLALLLPAQPARAENPTPQVGDPAFTQPGEPGTPAAPAPLFTGCTAQYVSVQNAAYEQQVVELVNAERATVGLPPLKRVTELDYAARYHAKDMHDDGYFNHDTYDGSIFKCDTWTRLNLFYTGWNTAGENIAADQGTPAEAMTGWMNSTGHRENILRSSFREIGVGYYLGSSGYRSYWVQDFGARSGIYPLVINREAASTDTPEVNLYIYREDSSWTEMRLKNDSGAWTGWQPFAAEVSWMLEWVKGTRTVTVEVRKGSTVRQASDSIQLTSAGNTLGNLPDSLTFIYDQSTGRLLPGQVTLRPQNTSSSMVLTWVAVSGAAWLSPQSGGGTTPSSSFTIAPTGPVLQTLGQYDTTLTVTVTAPASPPVEGSPKQIPVKLVVVDALDNFLYLGIITR